MAYVISSGGGGIDVAEYLSSLPTSMGSSSNSCRTPQDCWCSTNGGALSCGGQKLLCDGKVQVLAYSDAFTIRHIDGTTEHSIYGTVTMYFQKGDIFSCYSSDTGVSISLVWSEA